MALDAMQQKYIPRENSFYKQYYHYFFFGLVGVLSCLILMAAFTLFQVTHKPVPPFTAVEKDGHKMSLTSYEQPNLLPQTILNWASKAAIAAYTFSFSSVQLENQLKMARPYFTEAGWRAYQAAVNPKIADVVKGQLFVNSVVTGTPVISNQGPMPGVEYAWRVQIPFLATYQSANTVSNKKFYVKLTIVRVPTAYNPQGIGIDQFVMVPR